MLGKMRLSGARIVKFVFVSGLVLAATWRWTSKCDRKPQPTKGPATSKPQKEVLAELESEIEHLRLLAKEKKKIISQLSAELRTGEQEADKDDDAVVATPKPAAGDSTVYGRMDSMHPKNEYDVIPWTAFNLTNFYRVDLGIAKEPGGLLQGAYRSEVNLVVDLALKSLPSAFTWRSFSDGFKRSDRYYGTMYELYFRSPQASSELRRVRLVRSLGSLSPIPAPGKSRQSALRKLDVRSRRLHFVVPVSGRPEHVRSFLEYFASAVLNVKPGQKYHKQQLISVSVIVLSRELRTADAVEQAVKHVFKAIGFSHFVLVQDRSDTGAHRVLETVISGAQHEQTVVSVVNMDARFSAEFVRRCRLLPQAGVSTYWPIAFQLYNPKLTLGADEVPMGKLLKIAAQSGFWSDGDYDTVCAFGSDVLKALKSIRPYLPRERTVPDALLSVFRRLVRHKTASPLRVPDRALFRLYRPKECKLKTVQNPVDAKLEEDRFNTCRERLARYLAPHKMLASLAFGDEGERQKFLAADAKLLRDSL